MNKIHKYYTKKNYNKYHINDIYSLTRNGLFYEYNNKKNILKIIKTNNINIPSIQNILDIGGGEGDNLYFLSKIFYNYNKLELLDYSKERIIKSKKISIINGTIGDMRKLKYSNIKFNFISFIVSLMFLQNKEDINKTINKASLLIEKGGYVLISEVYSKKGHFTQFLKKEGFEGYTPNEINHYMINNGFIKKGKTIFYNKTIFGKGVGYLTEIIGINLTILIDILIPGSYSNFIILYQKK